MLWEYKSRESVVLLLREQECLCCERREEQVKHSLRSVCCCQSVLACLKDLVRVELIFPTRNQVTSPCVRGGR